MVNPASRKIVHIDMDAFYASVELRDQPELKGKPVVVAWDGARSVICAASYEARKYGLRSAMAVSRAKQLCPHAIYISPNFDKYREVSRQIHQIFRQYTDIIEPLSLDEAYLDVSTNFRQLASATEVAQAIRADIRQHTSLTASAGVAPNKFLAKIASDWNKPDGIFVIKPAQVQAFLQPLPLKKIPGVGQVTLQKMQHLGLSTINDLLQLSQAELAHHFGRYGYRLFDLARGIDNSAVKSQRQRQQLSTETTFMQDKQLSELQDIWLSLISKLWREISQKRLSARTITIKLKTSQFKLLTRSMTYTAAFGSEEDLRTALHALLGKLEFDGNPVFRLAGVGVGELSPYSEQQQLSLLEDAPYY